MFLFDDHIVEVLLQRELVAKAQPVVEQAETDDDVTVLCLLLQGHSHFVVVIAYLLHFAPHGFPRLVKGRGLYVGYGESVHQARIVFQLQSQLRRLDDSLSLVEEFVDRCTLRVHREVQLKLAIWRSQLFGLCHTAQQQDEKQADPLNANLFHDRYSVYWLLSFPLPAHRTDRRYKDRRLPEPVRQTPTEK